MLARLGESDVEAIIETNRLICYNSDFSDDPDRKRLYEKDVRIFYPDSSSTNMKNFQATDAVVQALLQGFTTCKLPPTIMRIFFL